ncbi:MAG: CxxxxCH/CxxCH domain-containing protein [Candidatus Latescibacterota bacterium]
MIARLLGAVLALGLTACSDPREDAARPSGPAAKVHPEDWLERASEDFHGRAIRQAGWDMSGCRVCHGANYAGGIANSSCLTCHAATPEGCQVCHGGGGLAAPPADLEGNVEATARGVGAHRAHVSGGAVAAGLGCGECHPSISAFADAAHLDGDGRAEVRFGQRATTAGSAPQYDAQSGTCAETYCHGGGRFGTGRPVVWTRVGQGVAACGTCHGLPPTPDTEHPEVPEGISCSVCHTNVTVDLQLADPQLHINGQTEASCATCHALPPPSPHPPVVLCSQCHGGVIGPDYQFVNASRHNNGQVDFF